MEALTLYELNNLVRRTLELTMDDTYWVRAEISELRVSRHCYMELVQKDNHGSGIVARARAQVWANQWMFMRPLFERATGQPLSAGMQVLLEVRPTFHEQYGFSLNVTGVDPSYTLGDIARHRQEILRKLEEEGIADMNKELPLPRLLQRIAVISAETAAGYGDFRNQLDGNRRHLRFHTALFPAVMQGRDVESSVIQALNAIAAQQDQWDAVVIIRGGGATADLKGFDSLPLAENVAQFPLPVITGIGHERDDTVIDLVAHTRVKTPTAAAEFLIHHQEAELNQLESLAATLTDRAGRMLTEQAARLRLATARLPLLMASVRTREESRITRLTDAIRHLTDRHLTAQHARLTLLTQHLTLLAPTRVDKERTRLALIDSRLTAADPARILRLGFSVTRRNGKAVRDASQLHPGDEVQITLARGTITATISNN